MDREEEESIKGGPAALYQGPVPSVSTRKIKYTPHRWVHESAQRPFIISDNPLTLSVSTIGSLDATVKD